MRAVILAGGKGTRLRPYTTIIPKPIVPVGDMSIMEIVVRQLVRFGCDHITVSVNHLAELIMAFFGDGAKWNVRIDYSREDKPLSTIGPLKLIEDLPDNFLVMNGDVLTNLNYRDLYQSHIDSGADATVGAYQRNVKIDFGVLEHESESRRITRFVEKPTKHFTVSMGVYAFSRRILGMVPDDVPYGFDQLMLDCIAQERDARAYPFDGYWLDIGRPDDYDTANATFDQLREVLLPSTVDDDGSGYSS